MARLLAAWLLFLTWWSHCAPVWPPRKFDIKNTPWHLTYDDPSPFKPQADFPTPIYVFSALYKTHIDLNEHEPQSDYLQARSIFIKEGVTIELVDKQQLLGQAARLNYSNAARVLETAAVAYANLDITGPQRWKISDDTGFGTVTKPEAAIQNGTLGLPLDQPDGLNDGITALSQPETS